MTKLWRRYKPFINAGIQELITYRVNFILYRIGDVMGAFVAFYLWKAVFDSSQEPLIQGFSMADITFYIIMSFVTNLLTTHDLSDIEQLCDRIFMIDKGQEIFDGTVSQLKETFGKMKTLSFELVPGQSHLVSHYEGLPDMTIDRQENSLNIQYDSSRYQSADIIKQTLSDFEIRDLKMVDTDIEDIIRRFYRKEL